MIKLLKKLLGLLLDRLICLNYFLFNNEIFIFLKYYFPQFNPLSIQLKGYPYSKCSKDYLNFKFLDDKIKRIQLLSIYYYRSDVDKPIELNYRINQFQE